MDVCFVELEAFTAEVLRVADARAKRGDIPPLLLARLREAVATIRMKYNR